MADDALTEELAGLLQKVAAAATPRAMPQRPLCAGDAAACAAAVIAEISETILPRRLTFTLEGDRRLVIEARGRRPVVVGDCSPEDLWQDDRAVLEDAAGLPTDAAPVLAALIARFCGPGGALSVLSTASALPPSFLGKGLPVADVSTALPAPAPGGTTEGLAPGESGTRVEAFFAACSAFARDAAILAPDGRIKTFAGTDTSPSQDAVGEAIVRHASQSRFAGRVMAGPRLVCLPRRDSQAPVRCYVVDGDEAAFATVEADDLAKAFDAWSRAGGVT